MKRLLQYALFWLSLGFLYGFCVLWPIGKVHAEPIKARQYHAALLREAHADWGLTAPVALFAGQIEQESGWNPDVCSAVACGLAQFTKPTATWISELRPDLAGASVFNPSWSIRALVYYDKILYRASTYAATERDRWAFTLSSYNGGAGNLSRELKLCLGPICNAAKWIGNVEEKRARSVAAHQENRSYVHNIFIRQLAYQTWGAIVA